MGSSGKLIISSAILDGTIATADLAAGAVSQAGTSFTTLGQTTAVTSPLQPTTGTPDGVTLTTTAGSTVLVGATGSVANSTAGAITALALAMDGTPASELSLVTAPSASGFGAFSQVLAYQPAAGTHTWKLYWRVTGGTATLQAGYLFAIEIKR